VILLLKLNVSEFPANSGDSARQISFGGYFVIIGPNQMREAVEPYRSGELKVACFEEISPTCRRLSPKIPRFLETMNIKNFDGWRKQDESRESAKHTQARSLSGPPVGSRRGFQLSLEMETAH
jgi:hypothetical protein